jgi:hypothetical protein
MNVSDPTAIYDDLTDSCAKIDRRNTRYQFDLETDIEWDRAAQPGLFFGPAALQTLGVRLDTVSSPAAGAFQWAYAMAVCDAFHELEDMVVRFTRNENQSLGPSRSVVLLCEEEIKHMELFARFATELRNQRPDLATLWDRLDHRPQVLPGGDEDRAAFPDMESQHYIFWINTLFFEEFTIFLADCLARDAGLIQPVWAQMHACHMREELQHIPTDVVHINSLRLSDEQRYTLSKVFFLRIERDFDGYFGLDRAYRLVQTCEDLTALPSRPRLRGIPIFQAFLTSPHFKRSRSCAPYLARLAEEFYRSA